MVLLRNTLCECCNPSVGFFLLQETNEPRILHLKAKKMKKTTTGDGALHTDFEHLDQP